MFMSPPSKPPRIPLVKVGYWFKRNLLIWINVSVAKYNKLKR